MQQMSAIFASLDFFDDYDKFEKNEGLRKCPLLQSQQTLKCKMNYHVVVFAWLENKSKDCIYMEKSFNSLNRKLNKMASNIANAENNENEYLRMRMNT